MKILVEVSVEIDPRVNARLDRATGQPIAETGDRLYRVSLRGRLGVETALHLKNAQVTAFALGEGHEEALRHALAAGAEHAVQLLGAAHVAALAGWLEENRPDVVIGDRLIAVAAAKLGWAHLAEVESMGVSGPKLVVVRTLGRGDREQVDARLPVMVRLDQRRPPRYIARARLKGAMNREIDTVNLTTAPPVGTLEVGALSQARPRTRLGAATRPAPVAARASDRLQALMGGLSATRKAPAAPPPSEPVNESPEALADSFVRYLAHHGLLDIQRRCEEPKAVARPKGEANSEPVPSQPDSLLRSEQAPQSDGNSMRS